MSKPVRVLIPVGLGMNCEEETAHAFELLGAHAEQVHVTDLITHRHGTPLTDYQILMFIGGFAYGDHIAGGLVLATRLRAHLQADMAKFLANGGLMLGICNGFQTLVRLGLLPGNADGHHDFVQTADLGPNDRLGYRNAWVRLKVDDDSHCVWTDGLGTFDLPSRHGEGKFLLPDNSQLAALEQSGQLVLRYVDDSGKPTEMWPHNPNGSPRGVAGVSDRSGRILGLMPHPDAFLYPWHHPDWRRAERPEAIEPYGLRLFEAGLRAARDAR